MSGWLYVAMGSRVHALCTVVLVGTYNVSLLFSDRQNVFILFILFKTVSVFRITFRLFVSSRRCVFYRVASSWPANVNFFLYRPNDR